jgi:hypothetical protein
VRLDDDDPSFLLPRPAQDDRKDVMEPRIQYAKTSDGVREDVYTNIGETGG